MLTAEDPSDDLPCCAVLYDENYITDVTNFRAQLTVLLKRLIRTARKEYVVIAY